MTHSEIFSRLLDESAAIIANPGALALPPDELHTEILLPLLPAMLRDHAIRDAWRGHAGRGFFERMQAGIEDAGTMPCWEPGDFEIQAAASYLAGPDAQALADTLRSEDPLRDITSALMNRILEIVWPTLPLPEPAGIESVPSVAAFVPRSTPRPFRDLFHTSQRWHRAGGFTARPWSSSNLPFATRAPCSRAIPIASNPRGAG